MNYPNEKVGVKRLHRMVLHKHKKLLCLGYCFINGPFTLYCSVHIPPIEIIIISIIAQFYWCLCLFFGLDPLSTLNLSFKSKKLSKLFFLELKIRGFKTVKLSKLNPGRSNFISKTFDTNKMKRTSDRTPNQLIGFWIKAAIKAN